MALKPHIHHIVDHTEAHNAATADDVIEARWVARRAIENAIRSALLTDPAVLTRAVTSGLLDAPQLRNNKFGCGKIRTSIINGACVTFDAEGNALTEVKRLSVLVWLSSKKPCQARTVIRLLQGYPQ